MTSHWIDDRASGLDRKLHAIFESTLDAIFVADDNRRYTDANPAACKLLGLSRERICEFCVDDFADPGERALVPGAWAAFLKAGHQEGEFKLRRPDGQTRLVEFRARANILPGQHLSTMRDITERRVAENELATLLAEAEQAARTREELLAIVAHELRSPLSVVLLGSKLVLRRGPANNLQPQTVAEIERVCRAAERMSKLIESLLDAARIEARSFPIRRTPQQLLSIVTAALDSVVTLAAEKSIDLRSSMSDAEAVLDCDAERLVQALTNLLVNAVKFTPDGGSVSLSAVHRERNCTFTITDTGYGIDAEKVAHVFDRYWQAERTRRGGAGLGLFIVKGIVEAHGGTISVESQIGVGTAFTIKLPA